MEFAEFLLKWWPIITAIIFVTFWCGILQSKINSISKSHDRHEDEVKEYKQEVKEKDIAMWTKIDSLQSTLNSLLVASGRLEGKIDAQK